MSSSSAIVVVMHATSKQGTSVVNSLLDTHKFTVKALTRDAGSDKAKRLAGKGAHVVEADATSAESLRAAFDGAYGVWGMTPVVSVAADGKQSPYEQEIMLGKLQVDAAAAAGVKVFQFSTQEDVEKRTKGKWSAPHFTAKARIMDYVKEQHPDIIGVFPSVCAFYTNWIERIPPKKDEAGVLVFSMPLRGDAIMPWVNPMTALGPIVAAAFLDPEKYRGEFIPVYDELLTSDQMAATFTEVTGIKARYQALSKEDMASAGFPPPVVDRLHQMYSYIAEHGYFDPERDMALVRQINPHPQTWADFVRLTGFDGSQSLDDVRARFAC